MTVQEVSNFQKRKELRQGGFARGESAGNDCCDCGRQCGRGWWLCMDYEYGEWECWCRDCAFDRLHHYDDFDPDGTAWDDLETSKNREEVNQ